MDGVASIAPESHLFLLDDAGVFFDEMRQEIHTFNTAAAYIWCCLEDGLTASDVIAAFQEAFACAADAAEQHVLPLLHRWQSLGFVEGLALPPAPETDFHTALGRLLTSPSLRERFARDPAATARALGVSPRDAASFVTMDPVAVDRQARALLAKKQSQRRKKWEIPDGIADWLRGEAQGVDPSRTAWAAEAWCRLVGTPFRIRFQSPRQAAAVAPVLEHLRIAPGARDHQAVDVVAVGDTNIVFCAGAPVTRCEGAERLAPLIVSVLRQIAVNRFDHVIALHAGAVGRGDACVLLPASPGGGKTTLTAALIGSGFDYLTDELVLLDGQGLRAHPVPLSLTVKPGSVDLLAPYHPDVTALPAHVREDEQVVRYLGHAGGAPLGVAGSGRDIRWIVFPVLDDDSPAELRPLPRVEALSRLLEHSLVLPGDLDRARVAALVRWIEGVDSFELPVRDLSGAVGAIRTL